MIAIVIWNGLMIENKYNLGLISVFNIGEGKFWRIRDDLDRFCLIVGMDINKWIKLSLQFVIYNIIYDLTVIIYIHQVNYKNNINFKLLQ